MSRLDEEYGHIQRPARLQVAVSDMLLKLVDDALYGSFDDMPRGDVQGVTEATASMIIKLVREAES